MSRTWTANAKGGKNASCAGTRRPPIVQIALRPWPSGPLLFVRHCSAEQLCGSQTRYTVPNGTCPVSCSPPSPSERQGGQKNNLNLGSVGKQTIAALSSDLKKPPARWRHSNGTKIGRLCPSDTWEPLGRSKKNVGTTVLCCAVLCCAVLCCAVLYGPAEVSNLQHKSNGDVAGWTQVWYCTVLKL
jgi:hypothetical protein